MTIPNIITTMRLIMVPLVVMAIIDGRWPLAFALFVVAGISDALDGILAKRFGMASELGALLDPIADKALIVSIYVTLALVGAVPLWLTGMIVARDVLIVAAVLLSWQMGRALKIAPSVLSKLNTAAQIVFAALLLGMHAFGHDSAGLVAVGQFVVALLTLGSMAAYLAFWLRHMAG